MDQMSYIDYGEGGAPEVLRLARRPRPVPGPNEVLVRVAYAGVNRPDCAQRIGRYPPPPGASPIIGLEVSGEVVQVGAAVTDWKAGDQVCALTPGGGYAEYCVAPAGHCLPIPAGMSLECAAALPETCFTVWDNVFIRGKLARGENFLVHGGAGGIGTTAIQMAHAFGARVMATAGSPAKAQYCQQAGADCVVNYREEDFVSAASRFTDGRGLDVILDMVAGPYLARDLDALAIGGRIAVIAFMGGTESSINITTLLRKRATITGSTLRPRSVAEKETIARDLLTHWWPLLSDVRLHPKIHSMFPLADAARAHALMESGEHEGKIVLSVNPAQSSGHEK